MHFDLCVCVWRDGRGFIFPIVFSRGQGAGVLCMRGKNKKKRIIWKVKVALLVFNQAKRKC